MQANDCTYRLARYAHWRDSTPSSGLVPERRCDKAVELASLAYVVPNLTLAVSRDVAWTMLDRAHKAARSTKA